MIDNERQVVGEELKTKSAVVHKNKTKNIMYEKFTIKQKKQHTVIQNNHTKNKELSHNDYYNPCKMLFIVNLYKAVYLRTTCL